MNKDDQKLRDKFKLGSQQIIQDREDNPTPFSLPNLKVPPNNLYTPDFMKINDDRQLNPLNYIGR